MTDGPVEIADGVWWVGDATGRRPVPVPRLLHRQRRRGRPARSRVAADHRGRPWTRSRRSPTSTRSSTSSATTPIRTSRRACRTCPSGSTRDDVVVVTEWRAQALLKHYGHRFGYYLVEEHDWTIPLGAGPATWSSSSRPTCTSPARWCPTTPAPARCSRPTSSAASSRTPTSSCRTTSTTSSRTRATVPPALHAEHASCSTAGLTRVQQRWPDIQRDRPAARAHHPRARSSTPPSRRSKGIDCGVFTLADADIDLKRLLRISEAKVRITEALLTIAEPASLVAAMNTILAGTHEARDCALFIDMPDQGWTMWGPGLPKPVRRDPDPDWPMVDLPGQPARAPVHPHPGRRASGRGPDADARRHGADRAAGRR